MRALVQRPYSDEFMSCILVRSCRAAQIPVNRLTKLLLGRKYAPGFFQMSHSSQLAAILDIPVERLLQEHSILPYCVAYYPKAAHKAALEGALQTGVKALRMGAVIQSVSDAVRLRRFCPQCVATELRLHGESYWHRAHNLPGVLVCTVHKVPLVVTQLPTTGRSNWRYDLPHDVKQYSPAISRVSAAAMQLAQRSAALLQRPFRKASDVTADTHRDALTATGVLSPGRVVNASRLAVWAQAHTRSVSTCVLNEKDQSLTWLQFLVRPGAMFAFPPLKHLLLETAIALTKDAQRWSVDHIPTGPAARTTSHIDEVCAAELRDLTRRGLASGGRLGVTRCLQQLGVWSRYRHDPAKYPKLRAAVNALRRSKAAERRRRRKWNV